MTEPSSRPAAWDHDRVTSLSESPGPDTVPGVTELRAAGFEPIEDHTGALWLGRQWPEEHSRWVTETRAAWLEFPNADGRLWLVRSPWPGLDVSDTLSVLWTWSERPEARYLPGRDERITEALAWNAETAIQWYQTIGHGMDADEARELRAEVAQLKLVLAQQAGELEAFRKQSGAGAPS